MKSGNMVSLTMGNPKRCAVYGTGEALGCGANNREAKCIDVIKALSGEFEKRF